jgi:predicted HD phosphohydrolase
MTEAEAQVFEKDPLCEVSLRMRQWDELAKEMHVPVIDLGVLKRKAVAVLSREVC